MKSAVKLLLWGVFAVGVWRGYVNYTGASDQDTATTAFHLLNAAINTIADIAYRWIPAIGEFVGELLGHHDSGH